ncbi:zinc finger CCCH domain-containing protein 7A [Gastrophryne carolinensis]
MSFVMTDRRDRQEDIKKGLEFVQSSLPYFGTQVEYEIFLQKLIRNLFNEGNDLYREGLKNDSINQYSEALSLANYAVSEDITVTSTTLERLHVNRAICYLEMGLHKEALKDCEDALQINNKHLRALYCKSKILFILEKYKDAYEAVARCSLVAPKDESVVKLTQDLAMKLGLKMRKAYVRTQPGNQGSYVDAKDKITNCLSDRLEPDLPEVDQCESPLSSFSLSVNTEVLRDPSPIPVSSVSPSMHSVAEVGLFPSALAYSETSTLFPISNLRDEILGDELDRMLDSVPTSNSLSMTSSALPGPSRINTFSSMQPLSSFPGYAIQNQYTQLMMPAMNSFSLTPLSTVTPQRNVSIMDQLNGPNKSDLLNAAPFHMSESSFFLQTDSPVDASGLSKKGPILENVVNGGPSPAASASPSPPKALNPLENTHEFRQACQLCFTKTGSRLQSYSYNPMEHKCKQDIFIGRIKNSADGMWKRIRPRPKKNLYAGQYYICKDVAQGNECTYPEICTFAYCQEEIDVWLLERKGAFCREALFGGNNKATLTIPHVLQEYSGHFVFLCEKCFDHKPRLISQRSKENPFICSHTVSKHSFEENKCLIHMFRDTAVKYFKIRPFSNQVVIDLCRHESRYGCLREDDCFYAHSLVELRVWIIQKETGISFEEIVKQSEKYWANEAKAKKPQNNPGHLRFNIKIACAQCWSNGQVIEADKYKKYCGAKATHTWIKDRQVVLVMSYEKKKWISIRPCPTKKPLPSQFELCHHVHNGKKCQYIGNCAFAHSLEEKEIWTYMREVGIQDMEKLCEKLANDKKIQKVNEVSSQVNKHIHLPTDYAEATQVDFHCWLCGRNCNSERQWKMHISSEKHKEKVFHSEDDQNIWQHRFPTGCFSLCKRFLSSACPDGEKCKFAHGNAELQEWEERSKVLSQKLEKARKDKLISPDDNDFGKYSFLINALN